MTCRNYPPPRDYIKCIIPRLLILNSKIAFLVVIRRFGVFAIAIRPIFSNFFNFFIIRWKLYPERISNFDDKQVLNRVFRVFFTFINQRNLTKNNNNDCLTQSFQLFAKTHVSLIPRTLSKLLRKKKKKVNQSFRSSYAINFLNWTIKRVESSIPRKFIKIIKKRKKKINHFTFDATNFSIKTRSISSIPRILSKSH